MDEYNHHCFWCSKVTDHGCEETRVSYQPCLECTKAWFGQVVFFETQPEPVVEGQPPMDPGHYPTGRYCVASREDVESMPLPEDVKGTVLENHMSYVSVDAYTQMFGSLIEKEQTHAGHDR